MSNLRILYCILFIISIRIFIWSETDLLDQINTIRVKQHLSGLSIDPLLTRVAVKYSEELYLSGKIEHRDQYGNRALERYRKLNGTAVVVGEILGAGADENAILISWMESRSHKDVILHKQWTHCGYGIFTFSVQSETNNFIQNLKIVVVLFTEKAIPDLQIIKSPSGIKVTGHCTVTGIKQVVIKAAVQTVTPDTWNPEDCFFSFTLNNVNLAPCFELGYINTEAFFITTDVIYPFKYYF